MMVLCVWQLISQTFALLCFARFWWSLELPLLESSVLVELSEHVATDTATFLHEDLCWTDTTTFATDAAPID